MVWVLLKDKAIQNSTTTKKTTLATSIKPLLGQADMLNIAIKVPNRLPRGIPKALLETKIKCK